MFSYGNRLRYFSFINTSKQASKVISSDSYTIIYIYSSWRNLNSSNQIAYQPIIYNFWNYLQFKTYTTLNKSYYNAINFCDHFVTLKWVGEVFNK